MLLAAALWATAFPVIRQAARTVPPFAFSAGRGLVAAVVVVAIAAATGAFHGLRGGFWRNAAVLGTVNGWLPNCLTAFALISMGAASVALVQSTTPLFVGILAVFLLPAERPGRRTVAGMAVGFAGIATILGPDAAAGGAEGLAGLLMLVAAISYAVGTVYVRRARPGSPLALSAGQQVGAAIGAAALSLAFEPAGSFDQPWPVWAAMVWVGLAASALPLTIYLSLVQRARATDAATTAYLQPVFAALWAALLLGEWPEPRVLLGGAVVLAGIWLTTSPPPSPPGRGDARGSA